MSETRKLLVFSFFLLAPVLLDDILHIKTYNLFIGLIIIFILWLSVLKFHKNGLLVSALLLCGVAAGISAFVLLVFLAPANPLPLNPALSILLGFFLFYAVLPGVGFLIDIFVFRGFEKRKSEKLRQLRERTQAVMAKNSLEAKVLFESLGKPPAPPRS